MLVLAAGIVPPWRGLAGFDAAEWDAVLRVNVFGVASVLAHALGDLSEGAAVVAVASLNSWRGDANIPAYAASKHAVLGIVRSAALELGRRNIRVNASRPARSRPTRCSRAWRRARPSAARRWQTPSPAQPG